MTFSVRKRLSFLGELGQDFLLTFDRLDDNTNKTTLPRLTRVDYLSETIARWRWACTTSG